MRRIARLAWAGRLARGLCVVASVTFCAAASAAPGGELHPSGGDDTEQLQAALLECTNARKRCDLRLGAGVFHTDVLLADGFKGSITGRGQGRTIIRALPHLRSSPAPVAESEPTLENPFPVLLHFANNGDVSISRLTIEVPEGTTVSPYTDPLFGADGVENALLAAIMVEGDRKAKFEMQHVTIVGHDVADAPNFSNITAGVRFVGAIRSIGGEDATRKLETGRFLARNNRIERTGVGILLGDANDIDASIVANKIDNRTYGVLTLDLGASTVDIVLNDIRSELEGILVSRERRPPDTASDYWIALNRVRVNENGTAETAVVGPSYDGIGVYDWSEEAESVDFNADIWANDILVGANVIAGIGIFSDGPGEVRVIGNRITGEAPLAAGIAVGLSRGTFVAFNDLDGNDPALPDVHLADTAHEVRVIEPGDNVVDEGPDNDVD